MVLVPPSERPYKPALIVVDVQEDFCPPNGSLAVTHGRDVVPPINALLTYPFALKVATKDFHPPNHISFASNHPPPNNVPFVSTATITNPLDPSGTQTQTTRLWPDHCVQGTAGAELLPELDTGRLDAVLEKGKDARVEMYSAFYDPFCVSRSGLAERLHADRVSDVFVVGLAMDYCVRYTAEDARSEGFTTHVVGEGTRAVDPEVWPEVQRDLEQKGVRFVKIGGEELERVKQWKSG